MSEYYTTGQVAKLLGLAPRTVSKLFDAGKLEGWRVPLSSDRRICKRSFEKFLKENDINVEGGPGKLLLILSGRSGRDALRRELNDKFIKNHSECEVYENPFFAIPDIMDRKVSVVVISSSDDQMSANFINFCREYCDRIVVVLSVYGEDWINSDDKVLSVRADCGIEELEKLVKV